MAQSLGPTIAAKCGQVYGSTIKFPYIHSDLFQNSQASFSVTAFFWSLFGKAKEDMEPATIVRLTQMEGELRRIEEESGYGGSFYLTRTKKYKQTFLVALSMFIGLLRN